VVEKHQTYVAITWPYSHEEYLKEEVKRGAFSYEEVQV